MITFTEKEFKSILNVRKYIDNWFWDKYTINPYNGCQFGCIYCDSRSQKYYLPVDFENNIIVKKNVGIMLDKRLKNARTLLPDVIGLGGTTDPYQPAEAKYNNSKECLKIIEKHRYPVHITTKSRLVLRDLDLLEQVGNNTWCTVSITITTADKNIARFLEKRVPSPEKRFDVLKTIKEKTKHIQTGVLLIPVVPFLSDSIQNFDEMVKMSKEAGADYILFGGGMTMRDMQALWFLKHISEKYPELIKKYEELYQFKHNNEYYEGAYEPLSNYFQRLQESFFPVCEKYQMPYRIKRFIPTDFRRENYCIAEKLLNKAYQLQITGKSWSTIFWAGQNIQNLKESISDIAQRNELRKIRNVDEKIELFIKKEVGE